MPPRNEDYISIGQNAPRLTDFPMPPTVGNDLGMMSSQTGKDVVGAYENLVNKVDEIQPQIKLVEDIKNRYIKLMEANSKDFGSMDTEALEQIAVEIENETRNDANPINLSREASKLSQEIKDLYEQEQDALEQIRSFVTSNREQIRDILKENPGLDQVIRKHQDYAVGKSVQEKVQQMDPQKILDQLQSSGQLKSDDLSKIMNLSPDQRENQLRQMMENQELARVREEQKKEQEAAKKAADAEALRRGMHDKDLQKEIKGYVKQGRITPNEADPYLKGEQSKEEFLNKFGPDIQAGHVNAQVVSDIGGVGGVGGEGGITGPGGPIPPPEGGHIDVRVINAETDPVPVKGIGGSGGGGGEGDGKGKPRPTDDEDKAEAFLRQQEIQNILSGVTDLATPGGGALAPSIIGGLGQLGTNPALRGRVAQAAEGLPGAGAVGNVAGRLGLGGAYGAIGGVAGLATGGLAAAGLGGKAWYETAQYQRQNERQFGTEQGTGLGDIFGSPMVNAQAGARLQNWMLAGEEIDQLTEAMSNLGSTAEQTAEALGPAAEALNRYRVLDPEVAATAAREGQMYNSPIGANEASVLGRNMQEVAGRGFSRDHLNEAAKAGNQAYQQLGLPGGASAAMAVANAYSSSTDPRNDMTLQQAGVTQQALQAGVQAQQDPLNQGQLLSMASGIDLTQVDPTSATGRVDMAMALPTAIANNVDVGSYQTDEEGNILKEGQNLMQAGMDAAYISELTGQPVDAPTLLAQLDTMREANTKRGTEGAAGLREEAQVSLTREEAIRTRKEEAATGVTQGEQYAKGGAGIDPSTIQYDPETGEEVDDSGEEFGAWTQLARGAGVLGAEVTGLDWLSPSTSAMMESGERGGLQGALTGTNQLYDEGQGTVLGALGSAGVNPEDVTTETGDTLEEALQDPTRKEAILADQESLMVGDKAVTATELAQGLHDESISFDRGFLGINSGLQFAGEEEGSAAQIDLTPRAAEYFEIVRPGNATDPYGQTGKVTNAQDSDSANRGDKPLHDIGRPVSGG